MIRTVVFVVGPNVKTAVHDTGHELLREPGKVFSALLRFGTVFWQWVKVAPALNCIGDLVEGSVLASMGLNCT